MSAADIIRQQISGLEAQIALLRVTLAEVEAATARPRVAPTAAPVRVAPTAAPVRAPRVPPAAAAAAAAPEATIEEWRAAVVSYITSASEKYPEGVPFPNIGNPPVWKEVPFVKYPGRKGTMLDDIRAHFAYNEENNTVRLQSA